MLRVDLPLGIVYGDLEFTGVCIMIIYYTGQIVTFQRGGHDLKGHRAQTQTAALRVGGS